MGITGYPMLKVVEDFAPKECFRMFTAWNNWHVLWCQQMEWLKEIQEVFVISGKRQKSSSTGFPYGHHKRVAERKASQRRAILKVIRARRAVVKHRMGKGRKAVDEIEVIALKR